MADSTGSVGGPVLLQFDSIQSLHSHLDKMIYNVVPAAPSLPCFHVVSHSFLVAAGPVNVVQPTVQHRNGSVNTVPPPRFKTKRKRGRPKKYIDPSVKRKPGRPRKHPWVTQDDQVYTETRALPKESGQDLIPEEDGSCDVEEVLEPRLTSTSSFGQKLEAELERPFDGDELERMEKDVSHRKPVVKLRQTRQGSVPFETENAGNSYLDHFPGDATYDQLKVFLIFFSVSSFSFRVDFTEVLSVTRSSEKRLRLLRGFFFWLQHSCMMNSFKPWLSGEVLEDPKECQEITPNDQEIFDMKVVLQL
ncbi:uncharacterized protein LOC9651757 isoform X2 [Selaginella moellendorffii]|uniref:uncharacterized protein LOC9651757 isoform X2 n=1 Tax=Selaginella moellendorffii TaxID=88036 RepID=UPI000D1C6C79|nr:uncharacterized protein LOC9651757 isoform X2 [Selaginella moellendorffii]|eukprot:XP_024533393.1 uncharacterized protein LOC9651757 isoform X2 [Selaginella moellendorffii]